jgi:3-phenylpropionate/trans-cinnamate dioxygenase ferredoxin component
MSDFESVLRTQDLGPGALAEVAVRGTAVAIANVGQQYFAVDARCPQDGTNLAREGRIEGDCIVCPGDHAGFDLRTGDIVDGGAASLTRYELRVEDNAILVGPPIAA